MAYSAPPFWDHGDIPDGTAGLDMQIYSDDIAYLYPLIIFRNMAILENQYTGGGIMWAFVHKYRWLQYKVSDDRNDGALIDPAGAGETVVLSAGTAGTWETLDLDTVDWLSQGKLYQVEDCKIANEIKDR